MLKSRCFPTWTFWHRKICIATCTHTPGTPWSNPSTRSSNSSSSSRKMQRLIPLQRVKWQLKVFSATYNSADLWWLNANSVKCLHNDTLQYSKYCMLLCLQCTALVFTGLMFHISIRRIHCSYYHNLPHQTTLFYVSGPKRKNSSGIVIVFTAHLNSL